MNSISSQQALVVSCLVAALCIMLLIAIFLVLGSISGAHSSQAGIMLVAPPYQIA